MQKSNQIGGVVHAPRLRFNFVNVMVLVKKSVQPSQTQLTHVNIET